MQSTSNKVLELYEYLPGGADGVPVVPVDLHVILDKFGLKAYDVKFNRPDVSGAFDRKKREIYLNSTDPKTRKKFTLAHELGHYFLHDGVEQDVMFRERAASGHKDQLEKEADSFAAELLMPESVIRLYWTVAEGIQQLADIFGVSYVAMSNRLRGLGFI